MAIKEFSVISRDLINQINIIENLVSSASLKDATKLLSTAEKTCVSLESLSKPDNDIQRRILANRRLDIIRIGAAIQDASKKSTKSYARKRIAK